MTLDVMSNCGSGGEIARWWGQDQVDARLGHCLDGQGQKRQDSQQPKQMLMQVREVVDDG